ncbi:T9SS type A sorting domain-containing protein [Hymenobacter elongatus]|uniref:T9SS type A sorting domain-containing protein n=1 Tax=Hymenobacter elongatus TaxID=877208 RepID=A0A4Z0PIZ6_9BACT|nr:T9SS type A sorting domain-containing protein [Hymenobacter elongatus]TGE15182.1 T9SS type A sorting domain-containing protein [Hymenobacter elongatus]
MRKTILLICLAAISSMMTVSAALAQALPNGTLETWETRGFSQTPTGWFTLNDVTQAAVPGFPFPINTTTRTTDKHGGNFAARLQNENNALLGPLPGLLGIGGTININSGTLGGIPFASRPARLEFYYKLTGSNAANDSAAVQVILTKTVNGQQTLVAEGGLVLLPTGSYSLSTVPLQYASAIAPDSIQIIFLSSTRTESLANTALYIDDVRMTGTVTSTLDATRNAAVTVYPNPSTDGLFTLATMQEASWARAAYTVSDVTGRVVLRQAAAPANARGPRAVDLRGHRAGVYTLRLDTSEGPIVHKLLIP